MKKIKFLKDHIGFKKDQIVESADGAANNYFVRCGIAEFVKEEKTKKK